MKDTPDPEHAAHRVARALREAGISVHDRLPREVAEALAGRAGTTYAAFVTWKAWLKRSDGDVALAIETKNKMNSGYNAR